MALPTLPYSTSPRCSAHAVAELGPALRPPDRIRLRERDPGGFGCGQRRGAGGRGVGRDRKDREQPVARELQDLAAVRLDRRHQAIEIAVEQTDHLLAGQPVAERRETAQVRDQEHRADALDVAAPDPALQDALAGCRGRRRC